jgi:hypothetical protein
MITIIVTPKNNTELQLISEMLKKMHVSTKIMTNEE